MPRCAIITDSDSSLTAEIAEQHGIGLVPISIQFGDESFRAEFDITDGPLFERVRSEGRLPTTAAPSAGTFCSAFEQALSSGADQVICFCVSSAVSGTYAVAQSACQMVSPERVTVVDSAALSMVQGFMALAAAEAAAQGADRESILAVAAETRERALLYGALSTLKYLAMGGRVPQLTARLGNLLNIRPILTLRDGQLDVAEKARTRKHAWDRMVQLCQEQVAGGHVQQWALIHVNAPEQALALADQLRQRIDLPPDPLVMPLGPGLSVHTGDGTVGTILVRA